MKFTSAFRCVLLLCHMRKSKQIVCNVDDNFAIYQDSEKRRLPCIKFKVASVRSRKPFFSREASTEASGCTMKVGATIWGKTKSTDIHSLMFIDIGFYRNVFSATFRKVGLLAIIANWPLSPSLCRITRLRNCLP